MATALIATGSASFGFDSILFPSGDTTGATDTAALIAAYNKAASGNYQNSFSSIRSGRATIYFRPGEYFINQSNAMMANTATIAHPTGGLRFQGIPSQTFINYNPTVSGPLCTNDWWLNLSFVGLSFYGQDANSVFLLSEDGTNHAIQDFTFEDCSWGGIWGNGQGIMSLTGANNNSEWKFMRCVVNGDINGSWIYIPNAAGSGSDQFLNFWFTQCKFWPASGSWINMSLGGQIKIYQCDVSGWSPSVDTYLFNLLGNAHARGVCYFIADGLRIEHLSDHALICHSQWPQGAICFAMLDCSSQQSSRTPSVVYCNFDLSNASGPNIEFRQCVLLGTHSYTTGTNNYQYQTKAIYRNCTILQQNSANAFITWTNGGNAGGAPWIRFQDCKTEDGSGSLGYKPYFDSDLYWDTGHGAVTTLRAVNFSGANDALPSGNAFQTSIELPANAAITEIWWWKDPSDADSGAFDYSIFTQEAAPTLLAGTNGSGGTPMAGSNAGAAIPLYKITFATPFRMTTQLMQQIVIKDTLSGGRASVMHHVTVLVWVIG